MISNRTCRLSLWIWGSVKIEEFANWFLWSGIPLLIRYFCIEDKLMYLKFISLLINLTFLAPYWWRRISNREAIRTHTLNIVTKMVKSCQSFWGLNAKNDKVGRIQVRHQVQKFNNKLPEITRPESIDSEYFIGPLSSNK